MAWPLTQVDTINKVTQVDTIHKFLTVKCTLSITWYDDDPTHQDREREGEREQTKSKIRKQTVKPTSLWVLNTRNESCFICYILLHIVTHKTCTSTWSLTRSLK